MGWKRGVECASLCVLYLPGIWGKTRCATFTFFFAEGKGKGKNRKIAMISPPLSPPFPPEGLKWEGCRKSPE